MSLPRTMPHPTDRTGPLPPGRADHREATALVRGRGPLTEAARDALTAAVAATDLVRESRAVLLDVSAQRQEAVLLAHEAGVSIRGVAAGIGVTGAAVQRLVALARARRAAS